MELTVLVVSSVLLVGIGYAFVQKVQQSPLVVWTLVCMSLFALSTRDLFRSRERGRPEPKSTDGPLDRRTAPDRPPASDRSVTAGRPTARADGGEDSPRTSLVVRIVRRVGGWFG